MLAAFGCLAWWGCADKAPTCDEPLHLVSAWLATHDHDFRIDPEDPPLWKYWATAGTNRNQIKFDFSQSTWIQSLRSDGFEGIFTNQTLFHTPGNDVDILIANSRLRMIYLGVALGALISCWAFLLDGPVAAITATIAFALDPNFLAHAALVKNDVSISLLMFALALCVWKSGHRLTTGRVVMMALICGAAMATKFSAVFIVPVGLLPLIVRAILPTTWPAFGRQLDSRASRLAAAGKTICACGIVSIAIIWASYDFRFSPTPYATQNTDLLEPISFARKGESLAVHPDVVNPSQEQIDKWEADWHPSAYVIVSEFLNRHRLLPYGWVSGFLYTHVGTLERGAFLCGRYSSFGWWYYFPLAMLFKTPTSILLASIIAVAMACADAWRTFSIRDKPERNSMVNYCTVWAACCLGFPPAAYLAMAMSSHIDLGLRHVLPIYPFLYVGLGVAAAHAWKSWRRWTAVVLAILGIGLLVETACAFPNFIPFFNVLAGGSRGGVALLSDSNIDWGQDLKLLVQWQHAHPDPQIYLCYFGFADPRYYGLHYVRLAGNSGGGTEQPDPARKRIIAISVMNLQGTGWYPVQQNLYAGLRRVKPLAVLGGSIYLFDPDSPS